MYIPKHFEVIDVNKMHELMLEYPLATLITQSAKGLNANHIPMILHTDSSNPNGSLQGHVARSNPLLNDIEPGKEALAIFHGPQAYISPSWYATKKDSGKVVPTWNYAVVHAYGELKAVDDSAWLRRQLENLTDINEADFTEPWAVDDAPQDFTEKLMQAIVGIEINITRFSGKWKVSQNQPLENRMSVAERLTKANPACAMAKLIEADYKNS